MTQPSDPGLRGALDRTRDDADGRLHAASTERNREAILAMLHAVLHAELEPLRRFNPEVVQHAQWSAALPREGFARVLEIGSGTGQHAAWFTPRLPGVQWFPTDVDPAVLPSIRAWADAELQSPRDRARLMDPQPLDVQSQEWRAQPPDAMVCINVIHIAPWSATEGLFAGASQLLGPGATLTMYGPYLHGDGTDAPSNLEFDARLRERDPSFGVRPVDEVVAVAQRHGMQWGAKVPMPNNNTGLVFVNR